MKEDGANKAQRAKCIERERGVEKKRQSGGEKKKARERVGETDIEKMEKNEKHNRLEEEQREMERVTKRVAERDGETKSKNQRLAHIKAKKEKDYTIIRKLKRHGQCQSK